MAAYFRCSAIDGMRLPVNLLEVKEYAKFLRTGRADEVEHVHALPTQHLADPNVAVYELNHETSLPTV